jgi:hypothetical protein
LNNVLLIIIESIREKKLPTWLEIVAFILGISGGLFFVIPAEIYNFFRCIFCCATAPEVPNPDSCCSTYKELKEGTGSSGDPYLSPEPRFEMVDEPYSPGGPYFSPSHPNEN